MGKFKDQLSTTIGNGAKRGFFKPAEFEGVYTLFIEPKSFDENARNPFYDASEERSKPTRLEVAATVTAFATPEHLEAGEPSSILESIVFTDLYLAIDLKKDAEAGKFAIARLDKKPNRKGKPSWVFRAVDGNVTDLVEKYYDKREAELDAAEANAEDLV